VAEKAKKQADEGIFRLAAPRAQTVQQYKYQRMMGPAEKAGEMFGGSAFWGAALAGAARNQFGKSANQLPPEMEARVAAQENTERRIQEENEFFEQLDAGQKSRYYRRVLAEEAMRAGLPDVGMQLFSQVQEEHDAAEKKRLELEKLGLEIAGKEVDNDQKILNLKQDELTTGKNKFVTIYPKGSSNPNSGKTAWVDENGRAQIGENAFVELGNYTLVRPQAPRKEGSGKSPRDLVTNSELSKLRSQQRDVAAQMRAGLRIIDIMKEAMGPTGSIDVLGLAGKGSSFVTKVVDEVAAMARAINKTAGRSTPKGLVIEGSGDWRLGDDIVLDGSQEAAEKYADTWDIDPMLIPASIRSDEIQARRYKAAIVNLTYAVARSEEPGNPRLSDDDFRRNLAQTADDTTNPETLRRVLLDRLETSVKDFEMFLRQLPPSVRGRAIDEDAMADYIALKDEFDTVFSSPFGTAEKPGPGITGKPDKNSKDLGDGFSVVIH